jgi:hypothetical protein
MKTLMPLLFVAALVAFLLSPLRFELAVSFLAAAGCLTIVVSDYWPRLRPLRVTHSPRVTVSAKERFGLAA